MMKLWNALRNRVLDKKRLKERRSFALERNDQEQCENILGLDYRAKEKVEEKMLEALSGKMLLTGKPSMTYATVGKDIMVSFSVPVKPNFLKNK